MTGLLSLDVSTLTRAVDCQKKIQQCTSWGNFEKMKAIAWAVTPVAIAYLAWSTTVSLLCAHNILAIAITVVVLEWGFEASSTILKHVVDWGSFFKERINTHWDMSIRYAEKIEDLKEQVTHLKPPRQKTPRPQQTPS